MVFAWLALSIAVGAAPMAQSVTATTGAVTGVVTDTTNAVVPGVTVTLSGPSVAASRVTTSDDTGAYRFSAVPPGEYSIAFAHAGFNTIVRDGVLVSLGFTASVHAELSPGAIDDRIVVSGAPLIDLAATEVTTHFDAKALAALPGARDIFAVFASTPGLAMAKPDVGGGNALALHEYTAYGLRAVTGMNRNEVEGIRVGGANGPTDNYLSDFGSFAEIAVKAVANSAAMPVPGTLAQYVSKSGGNAYHGSVYADVQDGGWQAHNIDDAQIARGISGGPGLDVRDVNRLDRFRDVTIDVGGYLKPDRAWWYAAYRDSAVAQRYAWLLDETVALAGRVGTGKLTYILSPGQRLVGYLQQETFTQPSYFLTALNQAVQASDALQGIEFPVRVWKAEYNAALSSALYVEARVGGYTSHAQLTSKSTDPRIVDTGENTVRGGNQNVERKIRRPQASGSISYSRAGRGGSHTLRFGGEYMLDQVTSPFTGYGNACNCVSTLANGAPLQVQLFLGSNVSANELVTSSAYADDTWRLLRRLTVSLGLRLDRYQPALPEQEGPAGQTFTAVDSVLTFSNWGPRLGANVDLTGDGQTVLKAHYGRFYPYPGGNFAMAFNPNPQGWAQTYRWTSDANGNGRWDPGEQGALISVAGGSASTRLDENLSNTHVDQTTAYVERAVTSDLAVRTGFVLNAKRATIGTINVNRPVSAYSSPIAIVDPGPDGRPGSADDGGPLSAFNLSDAAIALAPVNVTTNLPGSRADYYTWEITATKRDRGRLGLLASFTKTWSHESALGPGNDFTPNALINTDGGHDRFTTWQAKLYATVNLPWAVRLVPVVRSQSGTAFARTFVRALNYGNATIKAEPVGEERTPTITLVDVRTEKAFTFAGLRAVGFFDLYNLFNTNAEQTVTTSSGASWLRPTSITGPRILRIGARLDW